MWLWPTKHTPLVILANTALILTSSRMSRGSMYSRTGSRGDPWANMAVPSSAALELCRSTIDEFVLVDEEAIADGMRRVIGAHHTLIEGAAGAAVAGLMAAREQLAGLVTAVVLCGANVDLEVLKEVL